ncbi:MAG: class I SAM-dependent methyltransferase [Bdellovibrionaceae bacterium]|nr:class I SAM-dependent methyltransferase [Pseudobdellovibrionaceae bacterium]
MNAVVYCSSRENIPQPSERFAHIIWTNERPTDNYYLEYYDEKIVLQKQAGPETPLFVDFSEQLREWRRQRLSAKTDLLGKACAVAPGKKIFDLTLGLASDSLKLVHFGAQVTAVEQQPMMYMLVHDALARYNQEVSQNLPLEILHGDAKVLVQKLASDYEVFYLDPMFYLEKRTALPKKKMQFLSEIIGENTDDEFLPTFEFLRSLKKRIVIKRHPDASTFSGLRPKKIFAGKSIRFEIF